MAHFLKALLCSSLITSAAVAQTPTSSPTAAEIIAHWREAVHADKVQPGTAALVSTSTEDGIPGNVAEWVTTSGAYRAVVKREFDEQEIVVNSRIAIRRDWNGFLRPLQGQELARQHTAAFEKQVLAFGPEPQMQATASLSDDKKTYALKFTPSGGVTITWYVDAQSWLPLKSVQPNNEDGEITSTYSEWREAGGILAPHRGQITETDRPAYEWQLSSRKTEAGDKGASFAVPKAGPSDTRLAPDAPPIPFNFESSHIIFKVSVNGREPMWFIFDTGADQEVINSTRMADFGLKTYAKSASTGGGNAAEYDYAAGATFTLPGVELRNQHVAVLDQSGLERALGMKFGGILGYDFISRFIVEIDYEKKLITLHDPRAWKYSGSGSIVPISFDGGIPFMHGSIAVTSKPDIPAFFVMDFGAAETMTLTSPFVKANDLTKLAQTNTSVNRPAGMEKEFFAQNNVRGHVDELRLGKLVVQNIPINMSVNTTGAYASPNFSGTVGESIYRRYHVVLDYAHNRAIFEPTAEASKPFPERQSYGLSLLATGSDLHTYTVSAVRPGSPAEADGFKKGDVVAAMDGAAASEFTLSELREKLSQAGERRELVVMRGPDKLRMKFEVRLVSLDKK